MNKLKVLLAASLIFSFALPGFSQRRPLASKNVPAWKCDILIVGATIVTMDADHRVIEDGAVTITGNKFHDIRTDGVSPLLSRPELIGTI